MADIPKSATGMFVSVMDHTACIKVAGRANFTSSVPFKTLITELQREDFKRFILDLSECITMDSTFLGVLAGFALRQNDISPPKNGLCLELINPNPRVLDLLDNLGVSQLFEIRQGTAPAANSEVAVPQAQPSREEISRTCLEAHQTLMDVNPNNVPKFKEVTQFLAEDLNKLRSSSSSSS